MDESSDACERLLYLETNVLYKYEYHLKDHLGNVRVVFGGHSNGQPEYIQRTDYYPFGLVMAQKNYTSFDELSADRASFENNYLYNGKEWQNDEIGGVKLDWYDYGTRFYDPELGRWHSMDPLAEQMRRFTLYSYAFNNPLRYVDPDGMMPYKYNWETGEYEDEKGKTVSWDQVRQGMVDESSYMASQDAIKTEASEYSTGEIDIDETLLNNFSTITGVGAIYSEFTGKFKAFKVIDTGVTAVKIGNAIIEGDMSEAGIELGKGLLGLKFGTEIFISEQFYNLSQSSYVQTQIGREKMQAVYYWRGVARLYEEAGNEKQASKAMNKAGKAYDEAVKSAQRIMLNK